MKSTSIGYYDRSLFKDRCNGERNDYNCDTLVAECLDVLKATRKVSQKGIQQIIIHSDAQLVVNSINEKTHVQRTL